jgi:hypothetical protein
MKVGRTLDEMKEMIISSLNENNKSYILKIDNHDEARLLLESIRAFDKMNVANSPDSDKLKTAIKEIEEKLFNNDVNQYSKSNGSLS